MCVLIRDHCPCSPVRSHGSGHLFLARPIFGPLLFDNNDSDARDHCACERSRRILLFVAVPSRADLTASSTAFLSWLRLAIYMAVVSIAIVISFHLKSQPSQFERRMAVPLGLVFWLLALICLVLGLANYVKTVTRYSRRQALVQSGWKTQVVSKPERSVARKASDGMTDHYRCRFRHRRRLHSVLVYQCAAKPLVERLVALSRSKAHDQRVQWILSVGCICTWRCRVAFSRPWVGPSHESLPSLEVSSRWPHYEL